MSDDLVVRGTQDSTVRFSSDAFEFEEIWIAMIKSELIFKTQILEVISAW